MALYVLLILYSNHTHTHKTQRLKNSSGLSVMSQLYSCGMYICRCIINFMSSIIHCASLNIKESQKLEMEEKGTRSENNSIRVANWIFCKEISYFLCQLFLNVRMSSKKTSSECKGRTGSLVAGKDESNRVYYDLSFMQSKPYQTHYHRLEALNPTDPFSTKIHTYSISER